VPAVIVCPMKRDLIVSDCPLLSRVHDIDDAMLDIPIHWKLEFNIEVPSSFQSGKLK
jgi:hypothetical protein